MKFKIIKDIEPIKGKLLYIKDEYSFDFEPNLSANFSLLIGYLNITFDNTTNLVRQIWGCHPDTNWENKTLEVPPYLKGGLCVMDEDIDAGSNIRLIEAGEWKTYFDKHQGWICIGTHIYSNNMEAVEFATNCIIVLENQKIISLWLKPIFE
jgi:hypothetical protein